MKAIILGLMASSLINVIPGSTITYVREDPWQVISAEVSAYTSSVEETDDTPHLTASGSQTRPGVIACPSRLEFGTKVEIFGKLYVCEDRMNQRYAGKDVFDIWMPSKELAIEWGRQHLEVKIHDQ